MGSKSGLIKGITKSFKYSYPSCTREDVLFNLEVPIEIPFSGSTRELVQRIISMFQIPVYLENDLNEKLGQYVDIEAKKFYNERDENLLNKLKNNEIDVDTVVKNWEKMFKDNVVEFADQTGTSDEEVFAAAYHKLVHSAALETILQVENSYAVTVMDTLKSRDNDIKHLTQRQTDEMEEKLRLLNVSTTEDEINELATRQFEEQTLVDGRWGSQLDALWHTQRATHRNWLMSTLEEYQSTEALNTPSNSPLATFPPSICPSDVVVAEAPPRLEESFTAHLGSQLKQTHNIRLIACSLSDLCQLNYTENIPDRRRLQTSLSLYSSELSAVVVMSESAPQRLSPQTKLIANIAATSTEHHFAAIDGQVAEILHAVREPVEKRNEQRLVQQRASQSSDNRARIKSKDGLQPGDVYITRHSNLAEAHIVFHLVVDDHSLKSGDITSRHDSILALRNILKACCSNDITTLTLPILLRHELSEEMTLGWCNRRAELVLKCVKGFMLEAAAAGGAHLATLQLQAPKDLSLPVFQALTSLLPTVFRLAHPRKIKPTKTDKDSSRK